MKYNCKVCEYKTDRSDNFNRHMQTHSKEIVECDCGKIISSGALWRHKKNACNPKAKNETPIVENQEPIDTERIPPTNEKIFKVDSFDVRVQSEEGKVSYEHDPIFIDGVQFMLVPISSIIVEDPPNDAHDINLNGEFIQL